MMRANKLRKLEKKNTNQYKFLENLLKSYIVDEERQITLTKWDIPSRHGSHGKTKNNNTSTERIVMSGTGIFLFCFFLVVMFCCLLI